MNTYTREELMNMFGYCFQIFNAVQNLEISIQKEQDSAEQSVMGKYKQVKKIYDIGMAVIIGLLCLFAKDTSFMVKILLFVFIYFFMKLMFLPISIAVRMGFNFFASKQYSMAATNDVSNAYREEGRKLLNDPKFLSYKQEIPNRYFNINDLYLMYSYLNEFRAENFKEAANLLAEEKHRSDVMYNQQTMNQTLETIKGNVQYQSVISTINLLETKKINATLDAMR